MEDMAQQCGDEHRHSDEQYKIAQPKISWIYHLAAPGTLSILASNRAVRQDKLSLVKDDVLQLRLIPSPHRAKGIKRFRTIKIGGAGPPGDQVA